MKNKLSRRFTRAKEIYQKEGLVPLIKMTFTFLVSRFSYNNITFYIEGFLLNEENEADFLPKVQDFTFEIIATKQQADELAAASFDFGSHHPNERRGLEKGAVAFCFFIDGKLAHIGQVAMNVEAKSSFDSLPYRVDFAHKQACTGGTWTNPIYRGKGLMVYGYFKRFEFLREKGIKFEDIDVSANPEAAREIVEKSGHLEIPQIEINGKIIVGFDRDVLEKELGDV